MRALTCAVAAVSLTLLTSGCGSKPAAPSLQTMFSAQIDKATFPGRWPVVPGSGVLACDTTKGAGAVTFTPKGSVTTFAINAPALDWGKSLGWPDSKEIGTADAYWGDFISAGLRMCDEKLGTPPPPVTRMPLAESDLRGFYSPVSFWDKTFTSAPIADCAAQGADVRSAGDPIAITHAWRLPGGELACAQDPNVGTAGHLDHVELYFPGPGVDIHVALDAVASVLPADASDVGTTKPPSEVGPYQANAECHVEQYSSDTLAAAKNQFNPKDAVLQDPHKVTALLYTGLADSDGNNPPFNPASVHNATILAGDADEFNPSDGLQLC
ncbi:hypothetical protein [Mycolicibacterium llatzerense]|uniref:hypothetical protein n=1 Tax=Mycolicibacterium llatzerense TaxID=280871 RepID=UPI0008DCD226|nr:hypothetical protein [Mycolicibacterium llatzerense]